MKININKPVIFNENQKGIMVWHPYKAPERLPRVPVQLASSGSKDGFFDKIIIRIFEKL